MIEAALITFGDAAKTKKEKNKIKGLVLKAVEEIRKLLLRHDFFKTDFGAGLFFFTKRKELRQPVEGIVITGELRLYIIKLPIAPDMLVFINSSAVDKIVDKKLSEIRKCGCFAPAWAKDKGYFGSLPKCPDIGGQLFKFLLAPVLKDIYAGCGKRLGDLDISIIAGDNIQDALELVRQIEGELRYVTIAAENKEAAGQEADRIFGELGLSISMVGDCRWALKNADVIIILADSSYIPRRAKTRKGASVFNLSGNNISGSFPENTVLNGLAAELSREDSSGTLKEVLRCYSRKEVTGLVLSLLLNMDENLVFNRESSERIRHAFKRYGFRVSGFMGRHNTIKMDFLQKIADASS